MGDRAEKDSLGKIRIPEGQLYDASTQRAVENFVVSGTRFPRSTYRVLGERIFNRSELRLRIARLILFARAARSRSTFRVFWRRSSFGPWRFRSLGNS